MNPRVRQALIEDRRWYVLDAIYQIADRRLNEDMILVGLQQVGRSATADDIQSDLEHLEREGCIRLECLTVYPGRNIWVATLTHQGLQVRDNVRSVPGVAFRRPL